MTRFYKLSGSGNDFLALAEPWETPSAERIRAWCRRGVSIGADGLFVLRRAGGGETGGAGATMDYFNADGLAADLCLNGTRCAAQLAFHLGWA
ncbi:MAG TPA: diaminopimelate epimerase, partial [Thermoanaerobaculia bacterium]|nr:diaminopimelate epimerase [Thermoanaerobaculia bacterium]